MLRPGGAAITLALQPHNKIRTVTYLSTRLTLTLRVELRYKTGREEPIKMNYATRYISELKLHASTPRELTAKTGHTFRIGDEVATTVKASSQGRIIGFSKARALALGHSRPENEAIIHFYGGEFSELYPSGFVSRVHIDSIVSTNSL